MQKVQVLGGLGALLAMAALLGSCGGGGSATTPGAPGGTRDNNGIIVSDGHNTTPGNTNDGSDTTIIVPGKVGNHPFPFNPVITVPATESYSDRSVAGDTAAQKWLKNEFETLPLPNGSLGTYQNASLALWADQIFAGINAERAKLGLSQVKRDEHLNSLSQAHARDMALRNYFTHDTLDGMSPWDRFAAVQIPAYDRAGEVSAKGQESAAEVVQGWMTSSGHRAIVTMPELTHCGVGLYFDDSDYNYPIHAVMDFVQFKVDPATATGWYQRGDIFKK